MNGLQENITEKFRQPNASFCNLLSLNRNLFMGHHHHHSHDSSSENISVAFFLNFGFTIIEFIGGIYTNSLAIMSDALHDLGDSLSLGLAWYFQKLSKKKATKRKASKKETCQLFVLPLAVKL